MARRKRGGSRPAELMTFESDWTLPAYQAREAARRQQESADAAANAPILVSDWSSHRLSAERGKSPRCRTRNRRRRRARGCAGPRGGGESGSYPSRRQTAARKRTRAARARLFAAAPGLWARRGSAVGRRMVPVPHMDDFAQASENHGQEDRDAASPPDRRAGGYQETGSDARRAPGRASGGL